MPLFVPLFVPPFVPLFPHITVKIKRMSFSKWILLNDQIILTNKQKYHQQINIAPHFYIFPSLGIIQMPNVNQRSNYKNYKLPPLMSNYYDQSTNSASRPWLGQKLFNKQILAEDFNRELSPEENQKTIGFNNNRFTENQEQTRKMPTKIKVANQVIEEDSPQKKITFGINQQKKSKIGLILQEQNSGTKTKRSFPTSKKTIFSQGSPHQCSQALIPADALNIQHGINQSNNKISSLLPQKIPQSQVPSKCPQVERILTNPISMRQKFSHFLPSAFKKPISFEHQHLLKIMCSMDETIEFSNKNRASKFIFFDELKKRLRDSLRIFVELRHLEQILYLDENFYDVKWEWSYEKRAYDIMIVLPKIESRDARKTHAREVIISFLNQKHQQFIREMQINPSNNENNPKSSKSSRAIPNSNAQWHPQFQLSRYDIPVRSLPAHPQTRQAELRCFESSQIDCIQNDKLKQMIKTEKVKSQAHSFRSKSVMEMIFQGVDSKNIEKNILQAVKEKQVLKQKQTQAQNQRINKQKTYIDPDILKQLSQNIMLIYISKSVTNIFKVKLLEMLKERINHKFTSAMVDLHLEEMIKLRQIGYLKEITPSGNKPIIIQINKAKAKDIAAYSQELKQKEKIAQKEMRQQN